ncbi:MAG: hypothetical protein PHV98_00745 [Candidatus Omnitrophica bacterium]|nr:hypothetical protein [Candidatus Omnitrophota bacterium]
MAIVENEKLGIKFSVPDKPTVYQILIFDSKLQESLRLPTFMKLWETAKTIVSDWECEIFPDFNVPLEKIEGDEKNMVKIARIVEFVGGNVIAWRDSLDRVQKN